LNIHIEDITSIYVVRFLDDKEPGEERFHIIPDDYSRFLDTIKDCSLDREPAKWEEEAQINVQSHRAKAFVSVCILLMSRLVHARLEKAIIGDPPTKTAQDVDGLQLPFSSMNVIPLWGANAIPVVVSASPPLARPPENPTAVLSHPHAPPPPSPGRLADNETVHAGPPGNVSPRHSDNSHPVRC
jgi:hypothetical protein